MYIKSNQYFDIIMVISSKKNIDEFILSSSDDESSKYTLRNIDLEASKLGISFDKMKFLLIQKDIILNKKSQN